MDKKKLEELTADHERWDNRELGASEEHLAFISDQEQQEMDDDMGLQLISIRLNKSLIETLKGLAKVDGIGYQPLIRQVLTRFAKENEYKLDVLLSAAEAAVRADKLFAQALKLRVQIPDMQALSSERVVAETDFTNTLSQAQMLFAQALNSTTDPILKQHAKLRIAQIAEVCQRNWHDDHDKTSAKARKKQAS